MQGVDTPGIFRIGEKVEAKGKALFTLVVQPDNTPLLVFSEPVLALPDGDVPTTAQVKVQLALEQAVTKGRVMVMAQQLAIAS